MASPSNQPPCAGQLYRSRATGSVFRVVSIDLSIPGDCVELRLVEPSKALLDSWAGIAESNRLHPSLSSDEIPFPEPTTLEGMRALHMSRPMFVELAWFGRAGTLVEERAA